MTLSVREQIAQISDVAGVLRLIGALKEVHEGAVRLASGATRGVVTFEKGYVTGAFVTKGAHGVDALKQMLKLPDAAFQFLSPDEAPVLNKDDKFCLDIKALIDNNMVLDGLPTNVCPIGDHLSGSEEDVNTGAVPALHLASDVDIETGAIPALSPNEVNLDLNMTSEMPAFLAANLAISPKEDTDRTSEVASIPRTPAVEDPQAVTGPRTVATEKELEKTDQNPVLVKEPEKTETAVAAVSEFEAAPIMDLDAPVKAESLDGLLRDLSSADDRAEFAVEEAHLDTSEEALSADQKILLQEISKLHDPESFNQADPSLSSDESGIMLSEQKLGLLEAVDVDTKPFNDEEIGPELSDERGLTDDQKVLLEEVSKLSDPEEFHSAGVKIDNEGHALSEEERWMMEQNAQILSPEEARAEFAKSDPILQTAGEVEFKPFVEPEIFAPPQVELDVSALNAIPAPEVMDGDFAPITGVTAEPGQQAKREAPRGLIGRATDVWHKFGKMEDGQDRVERFRPEKLIGPVILVALCVGLFTIPGYLKKLTSAGQSEDLAADQMQLAISDEMDGQVMYAVDDPTPSHSTGQQGSSSGGSGATNNGGSGGEENTSSLALARSWAAKGWMKRAKTMYEEYLRQNPSSIAVRIELIRFLISNKETEAARSACIAAMKLPVTLAQQQEIWGLLNVAIRQ